MSSSTNLNTAGGRLVAILTWILKIALALVFTAAAAAKLSSQPMMVQEFGQIGFGQGFRYFTGAVEVASSLLLLWPRTAFIGAFGLLCVCIGAFVARIALLHGDLIHVIVLGGLAALVLWLSRPPMFRTAPVQAHP